MTELSHNMRQALIDLDNPYCDGSSYWTKNTMSALEKRELVFRRDNGITWSWEVTTKGKDLLAARGTSGCAMCDDLTSKKRLAVNLLLSRLNHQISKQQRMIDWLAQAAANNGWDGYRVSAEDMKKKAEEAIQ